MDGKFDAMLTRIEATFERWLKEFEDHPIKMGLKALILIYVLRFLKRQLV